MATEERPRPGVLDAQVPQNDELLALHAVCKSWGPRRLLEGLELVVDRGTLTAIRGVNGIGKTTLLRIAAGLIMPDQGVVRLDGLHPRHDRRRFQERIGLLAAGDRGLYARLTVCQHLELWGRLSLLRPPMLRSAVERTIAQFALGELASSRVDRLSMGQRQRLRMAMAFLHDPELVLLDEPLNSLDNDGAELLGTRLSELTARGGAAIWCSPGTDAPPVSFDAELVLEDGKLRTEGGA